MNAFVVAPYLPPCSKGQDREKKHIYVPCEHIAHSNLIIIIKLIDISPLFES